MTPFHQILGNNLVANITNFTVWFAITFWIFIETQSVFATGMIAGIYLVFTAAFGFWQRVHQGGKTPFPFTDYKL